MYVAGIIFIVIGLLDASATLATGVSGPGNPALGLILSALGCIIIELRDKPQ